MQNLDVEENILRNVSSYVFMCNAQKQPTGTVGRQIRNPLKIPCPSSRMITSVTLTAAVPVQGNGRTLDKKQSTAVGTSYVK